MDPTVGRSTRTLGRVVWLVAMAAAVLVVVDGCRSSPYRDWKTFSDSDAVGSWCGQAGDRLAVADDKSFRLTEMSAEYYGKVVESHRQGDGSARSGVTGAASASGRWEIYELSGTRRLHLLYDKINEQSVGFGSEFFALEKGTERLLVFYASDPDLGFDYHFDKCDDPQPGKS